MRKLISILVALVAALGIGLVAAPAAHADTIIDGCQATVYFGNGTHTVVHNTNYLTWNPSTNKVTSMYAQNDDANHNPSFVLTYAFRFQTHKIDGTLINQWDSAVYPYNGYWSISMDFTAYSGRSITVWSRWWDNYDNEMVGCVDTIRF